MRATDWTGYYTATPFTAKLTRRYTRYHIVDTNEYGLNLLRRRIKPEQNVTLHNISALEYCPSEPADVVFSVGLIEHFDPSGTEAMIRAHFKVLRPGGCAIISFPTPTWLYRVARNLTEALGLWKFPDERPLRRLEVINTARELGEIVYEKTLWPLVFTQQLLVIKKG